MALPILDGNQSATTLSTILSSGQHITAHTVVSLGTQAITDIVNATSAGLTNTQLRASAVTVGGTVTVGNSVTISSLPAISGTVTAIAGTGFAFAVQNGISDFVSDSTFFPISGTVTANVGNVAQSMPLGVTATIPSSAVRIGWADEEQFYGVGTDSYGSPLPIQIHLGNGVQERVTTANPLPISGTVTVGNSVTIAGTVTANPTGTQTIAGTVTVGVLPDLTTSTDFEQAGTQIAAGITNYGSIPVDINSALPAGTNRIGVVTIGAGTVTIGAGTAQIGSVTVGNSVTIGSLPAISGTVTANTFALQGTAVTTSNFTSTTASTVLANFNATRQVLTIFNEGAGNLHICAGATCTTIAYQVRLSAGDYYEVPNHQTTITHSAVFATAGTARVTEVS